jgi:hypothetical protein
MFSKQPKPLFNWKNFNEVEKTVLLFILVLYVGMIMVIYALQSPKANLEGFTSAIGSSVPATSSVNVSSTSSPSNR